jgi:glycosyltransferase involved in cell wall biosynthesis
METVSALVCTRNRPDSLLRAVRSLLKTDCRGIELIVIDQSEGPATQQALAEHVEDRRLRYVRSDMRGKGAALNQGLRLAHGEFIVCTDDDCEAPPGWVPQMARTLADHPTAAIMFCNVTAGPHDPVLGYVPTFQRRHNRLLRSVAAFRRGMGLGAGMALRRDAAMSLGGFDESFGPGARFSSGDDWDISQRALMKGGHVFETAQLSIVHHGFRTLAQGREHAQRDWLAIGALAAKAIRSGHLTAIAASFWFFAAKALWPPILDALRFKRPRGVARISGYLEGFAQGVRIGVDPRTLLFRLPR